MEKLDTVDIAWLMIVGGIGFMLIGVAMYLFIWVFA